MRPCDIAARARQEARLTKRARAWLRSLEFPALIWVQDGYYWTARRTGIIYPRTQIKSLEARGWLRIAYVPRSWWARLTLTDQGRRELANEDTT